MSRFTDYNLMVPADAACAIVRRLTEGAGMSTYQIARGAGLAECVVTSLAADRRFILSASYDSLRRYYASVTRERAEQGLRWQ